MLNKDTRLFMSVTVAPGNFGALLYNRLFEEYEINAAYKPMRLTDKNRFGDFINACKIMNVEGLSVSMPFKKMATEFCDTLESFCGNINTISFKNEKATGYNTDIIGFEKSCENLLSNVKTVRIYGNGAVCQSIWLSLIKRGIDIQVVGRGGEAELSKPCDMLINATPFGTYPIQNDLFVPKLLENYKAVFDVVVYPKTMLIENCRKMGIPCVNGVEMCVEQFMAQFEIYMGFSPDKATVKDILKWNGYYE